MKLLTSKAPRGVHTAIATLFALLVCLLSSSALAQEDPLRLTLLNAAAKGGASAHGSVNEFLKKSDDINTTSQDEVWEYADKELGLEEKDFRSSSLREENTENFKTIMKELDLEALLIVDVFSKGRKFQLVAIGPDGTEIADIRRDVSRGRLSKDDAKGVLRDTFKELVPIVREFREAGGWSAEAAEEEEEEEVSLLPEEEETEEEGDEEASIKDEVVNKRKGKYPAMQPGARIQIGLLAGIRDMKMTADTGFELTHASPWVGFGGRVDFVFTQFTEDSALGASVLGGYAPFTTIFLDNDEFKSAYARLGGELRYLKAFSPELMLNVFGGAEATSVTIAQNPFYTGHRYLMARVGVGIMYQVGPVVLELAGAVLPVFGVNNSAGAFGDVEGLSLGFEPAGGLSFDLSDDISATLRYTGQIYSITYPSAVVLGGQEVSSTDVIHTGLIAIGYGL